MNVHLKAKRISPIKAACDVFNVTREDIQSNKNTSDLFKARICIVWAYKERGFEPYEIGDILNKLESTIEKYFEILDKSPGSRPGVTRCLELFKAKLKYF